METPVMARRSLALSLGLAMVLVGCSTLSNLMPTREKGAPTAGPVQGAEPKAAEQKAAEQKAAERKAAERRAAEQRAIEQKAAEQKAAEQKTAEPASPPAQPAVSATPPPQVALAAPPPVAARSPRLIWVPDWGMYVLEGYDIVHYQGVYYYLWNGYWYASPAHSGPWHLVGTPPPGLAKLPPGQFHAHLPPDLTKKDKVPPGHR